MLLSDGYALVGVEMTGGVIFEEVCITRFVGGWLREVRSDIAVTV